MAAWDVGAGQQRFEAGNGMEFPLLLYGAQTASRSMSNGKIWTGMKWVGRKAEYQAESSAKLKNVWSYSYTLPTSS
jgi:hypothetical protein